MKQIKTLRISDELMKAMEYVAQIEKIEESQSLRKLAHLGFETYVIDLYAHAKITLREAAHLLKKPLSEVILLMNDKGVSGNIGSKEVLQSLKYL